MAVDLSQMTEAQKAALREQLNAEAKSSRQENRKAYEDLRHEFMVNVENQLGIIVKSVKQFKDWLGSESDAFTKIMQRYGQTKFDDQKSFTITDGDFRRWCEKDMSVLERLMSEVMTPNPVCVKAEQLAVEVLKTLETRHVDDIVVVNDDGVVQGFIDVQDLPGLKLM